MQEGSTSHSIFLFFIAIRTNLKSGTCSGCVLQPPVHHYYKDRTNKRQQKMNATGYFRLIVFNPQISGFTYKWPANHKITVQVVNNIISLLTRTFHFFCCWLGTNEKITFLKVHSSNKVLLLPRVNLAKVSNAQVPKQICLIKRLRKIQWNQKQRRIH